MATETKERPSVRLAGVNKHVGAFQALTDINVDIPVGQVCIVVGSSGSGKSTVCRPSSRPATNGDGGGVIEVDKNVLAEERRQLAALRAHVGLAFPSFNLFAHQNILENVGLGPMKVRKI